MDGMAYSDGRLSSYATEAEIKATSVIYNIDIFVQNVRHRNHEWQLFSTELECNHERTFICLTNDENNLHYNFI